MSYLDIVLKDIEVHISLKYGVTKLCSKYILSLLICMLFFSNSSNTLSMKISNLSMVNVKIMAKMESEVKAVNKCEYVPV